MSVVIMSLPLRRGGLAHSLVFETLTALLPYKLMCYFLV